MIKNLPNRFKGKTLDDIQGYESIVKQCRQFRPGESLTFCGDVGRGKTHLAAATAGNLGLLPVPEYVMRDSLAPQVSREPKIVYLSTIGFLMQCNDYAVNGDKMAYLDELIREPTHPYYAGSYDTGRVNGWDVVILDDFGAEKLTDAARQNLFYLINGRYENLLSMLITTNLTINQIHQQEPRIASRLAEMGAIYQMDGRDYRI